MAKENKTVSISSTCTEEDGLILQALDKVITESRAEWIRKIVLRAARKRTKIKG